MEISGWGVLKRWQSLILLRLIETLEGPNWEWLGLQWVLHNACLMTATGRPLSNRVMWHHTLLLYYLLHHTVPTVVINGGLTILLDSNDSMSGSQIMPHGMQDLQQFHWYADLISEWISINFIMQWIWWTSHWLQ